MQRGGIRLKPADGEPRRHQRIGYAAFATRLEADPAFARWLQRLSDEAATLADRAPGQLDRHRHPDRWRRRLALSLGLSRREADTILDLGLRFRDGRAG